MKTQKLSLTEFNNVIAKLRRADPRIRNDIALLVWDCAFWREEAKRLELELEQLRNPKMIETKEIKPPTKGESKVGAHNGQRWFELLRGPKEHLELALKWSGKTLDEIMDLANEYEEGLKNVYRGGE